MWRLRLPRACSHPSQELEMRFLEKNILSRERKGNLLSLGQILTDYLANVWQPFGMLLFV